MILEMLQTSGKNLLVPSMIIHDCISLYVYCAIKYAEGYEFVHSWEYSTEEERLSPLDRTPDLTHQMMLLSSSLKLSGGVGMIMCPVVCPVSDKPLDPKKINWRDPAKNDMETVDGFATLIFSNMGLAYAWWITEQDTDKMLELAKQIGEADALDQIVESSPFENDIIRDMPESFCLGGMTRADLDGLFQK